MTSRSVELRSDTFTRPTAPMRRAMAEAEVGDDVWHEDPTVDRLEARAAEVTGKEAAVFVPSGTMGNLMALVAHTRLGTEVIVGDRSHIFRAEAGGGAVVGGLQYQTLPNRDDGRLRPDEVRRAIRSDDDHEPPTACIALENTHNQCGGAVLRLDEMEAVAAVAHDANVPVHLDGARIFNAATAINLPVRDVVASVDSVMFCVSKALGAPVGSLLCGERHFIERARRLRKLLGGGMRQAGVLAAAGLYVLDHHIERLSDDHANARRLAEGLAEIPGIAVHPETVETNMVFFDLGTLRIDHRDFCSGLAQQGVRIGSGPRFRAVTSYEVNREDIEYALQVIARSVRTTVAVPA